MPNNLLGCTVTDVITGLKGVVTARREDFLGRIQVLVQPRTKVDGEFVEGRWLDEERVEIVTHVPRIQIPSE